MSLHSQKRQVGLFSVRNQLTLLIILIVVVPLLVISYVNLNQQRSQLNAELNQEFSVLAEADKNLVATRMEAELRTLNTLAQFDSVVSFVEASNAQREGTPQQILADIAALDETWQNTTDDNLAEIRAVLNAGIVGEFSAFLARETNHVELFVTDVYGAVIASTNRTSDYYQADEGWWQAAWNNGSGAEFINSQPEFDDSVGEDLLQVSVPITNNNGETIGVLRSNLRATVFTNILGESSFANTGHVQILTSEGVSIVSSRSESDLLTLPNIVAISQASASDSGSLFETTNTNGTGLIVLSTPLTSFDGRDAINNLGWYVVVVQDQSEAFGPINEAITRSITFAILAIVVSAVAGFLFSRFLTNPLQTLTEAAQDIGDNQNWSRRVQIDANNEFGLLGNTFNTMTEQIQDIFDTLEERVQSRTKDLETSAEIASAANQVRETGDLLSLTVNLIRDRFDLYYVQVYLLDFDKTHAVLKDGTGFVGRKLLGRNHRLPLDGKSIVANAYRQSTPQVVPDTQADSNFLPNDLLPNTRTEVAIPLRLQDEIIGVLDMQHSVPNFFDEGAIQLFQSMADQLAVIFENVNLFQATERRAAELETVAQVSSTAATILDSDKMLREVVTLTRDSFGLYHSHVYLLSDDGSTLNLTAGAGEPGMIMMERGHSIPFDREHSLVARAARERAGVIVNNTANDPDFLPNELLPETRSEMAIPMVVGEKLVGVLDVQSTEVDRFAIEDVRVMTTLASQVAVAVENARAFADVEEARAEVQRVFSTSIDMLGSANFEGYFTTLNEAWVRTLGWSREELMAEPFVSFVHPDDVEATNNEAAKLFSGSETITFENRYLAKNGEYHWISWNSVADIANELVHFVARDITHTKHAQAEMQRRDRRFNAIATTMPGAIFQFFSDEDGWHVPFMSSGIEAICGVPASEIQKDINAFVATFHPDDIPAYVASVETVLETLDPWFYEGRLINKKTGETHWWQGRSQPYRDEETGNFTFNGVVLDVTANKMAETEIQKRANEMEVVAQVSAEVSSVLDVDELLWDVSLLTRDSFNLYHAHIYLLNDVEDTLVLTAGAGDAGKAMVAEHRIIPFDAQKSIVARAARERQGVIVNDVTANPDFLPHPMLPETKSEMAIPMVVGNKLVGVLDVQANITDRFTDEDVRIKTTLASQIAVGVENARAFAYVEQAQKEAQDLQDAVDQSAIVAITNVRGEITYVNDKFCEISKWSREELIGQDHRIINSGYHSEDFIKNVWVTIANGRVWQGEFQNKAKDGSIYWVDTTIVPFMNDSGKPYQYVAIRYDITNLKLQEAEIQKRANEMEVVAKVSAEATTVLDVDRLLWDVTQLTRDSFNLYHAHVYLLNRAGDLLELVAGAGEAGKKMVAEHRVIPFDSEQSIVARTARERQGVIVNDVAANPNFLPHPMLPETKSEMAIPMIVGDKLVGVLDVQANVTDRFTDEDVRIKTTLASQVAVAVQNARSFEETQLRLRDVQLSNRISDITRDGGTVDHTLEQTLIAIIDAFGADNAVVSTYSVADDTWHGFIGAGTDMTTEIARTFVDPGPRYPHGMVALEQRAPEAVDVAASYPDFPQEFLEEAIGIKSVLVIPLFESNEPFGVMFFNFVNRQHTFSDEEISLAQSISTQVSLNLDRLSLTDTITKRAQELATVAEVSTATTTILDVDELLLSVVELTRERFNLYHAQIYLYEESSNRLVLAAGSGDAGQLMKTNNHALDLDNEHSVVVQAVKGNDSFIINNTSTDANFLPNPLLPETQSEMSVPIRIGGEIIGVLDVQSDVLERFTGADAQIMSTLADQVAVAIRNAQLFAETQLQAERERENAERLREVDRLKSQFLANMSHELRTPLNSIIGYSEVLLDGVDGDLTEDAEEDVEAIHSSGKHLLSIINEILDLAKIEAGEMQLDRKDVDIVEFCKEIVRNGQMLVKSKDVELIVIQEDEIPMIYADPVRLRQIIWNLVSNATKFTEEGTVTVRINRENDDFIGIAVEDSGVGMSEEGLSLIFERFSQVDGSSTRRAGGTGLGLTITRQLIEMHGGDIVVTSELGAGSTFFITLPVNVNQPEKSTSNGATP